MPKILDRLVRQLKKKGFSQGSAFAIATKSLQKNKVLKKGSQKLTKKGSKRNTMSPGQRAKARASKQTGRKTSDFTFRAKTNSVRVKKKKKK